MLQRTSRLFFWLYVATLLLVGSGGMFFAQYELATLYRLDLSSLPASASIQSGPENFLNQYRFLKASELGIGIFCVVFWREIFRSGRLHAVFLAIVACGVFARGMSLFLDGMPHMMFIGFLIFELLTGALVYRAVRLTRQEN